MRRTASSKIDIRSLPGHFGQDENLLILSGLRGVLLSRLLDGCSVSMVSLLPAYCLRNSFAHSTGGRFRVLQMGLAPRFSAQFLNEFLRRYA
jgi:hypothetical protein